MYNNFFLSHFSEFLGVTIWKVPSTEKCFSYSKYYSEVEIFLRALYAWKYLTKWLHRVVTQKVFVELLPINSILDAILSSLSMCLSLMPIQSTHALTNPRLFTSIPDFSLELQVHVFRCLFRISYYLVEWLRW
jgi:hypothetical protein